MLLPYRLVLLLMCLSIGRTVGQEEEEEAVDVEAEVVASAATADDEAATEQSAVNEYVEGDEAADHEVEEVEYEWKPFLQEFPNATCPHLQGVERWMTLVNYQCPGKRSWYSCIDDLLELPQYRRFRCRPILFRWEKHVVNRTATPKRDSSNEIAIRPEEVHMAGPNFIAALKERGRHGSNFCMLISRMNSRLGVAGTPTMVLYVDGSPVARVDEQLSPSEHLPSFIESLTDWYTEGPLLPNPDGNVQVEPIEDRSQQWLLISLSVYCISSLYHFVAYTERGKRTWAAVLQRIRG